MNLRKYLDFEPTLGADVYVDPMALVIGQVVLADDVSIWPMSVVRGDVNTIEIGARTNIQDGCILHVTHDGPYSTGGLPLVIGEDVTVGHRVTLHACTVGDRCLVGMSATVMDGAVVENDVLLGAGSLVPPGKRLAAGSLYRGSPVQFVRALTDRELAMLRYSAGHYLRLKNRYLSG